MAPSGAPELNQTARLLLGMVAEGHTTGYAIKAEIERSTRMFWSASVGGIYPELRRLAEAGLLDQSDDPRGGARRHCYALTRAGRRALTAWLTDEEATFEVRNEPLLRLRFAGVLEPAQRGAVVRRMRELHAGRVELLARQLQDDEFDDGFDRMATEYALGLHTWARDWAADAEARVAATSS